jgi:pimeloyl-ACP methyl ester carboxylesterase
VKRMFWIALLLAAGASGAVTAQNAAGLVLRGKSQTLPLYGSVGGSSIILTGGDLGWVGLAVHVAEFLAARGYYVVGFNSKAYLSSFTTKDSTLRPQDVPGDFKQIIDLVRQKNPDKPILVGISEGAGLSVLAATDPGIKSAIRGILGLGLPDQSELGWKWQDFTIWITKRTPNEPSFMVEDIINKVSPAPFAEIHSTHDEFLPLEQAKAMFSRAGEPKRMWVVESSNHRFSDNRPELDRCVLEALQWIRQMK